MRDHILDLLDHTFYAGQPIAQRVEFTDEGEPVLIVELIEPDGTVGDEYLFKLEEYE